ncbi:PIR Superfamily Protein [Plasmodium ovale wallikeri]|uniref:PIR Superfamily Protein n=1 Tax=Plasmodium ovale wallikeri TaxID=864142 RepID=A0A1A9AIE2_PLAOA|nr:PIR Superfamily Protein [Plasmodium ovale wallikeri]
MSIRGEDSFLKDLTERHTFLLDLPLHGIYSFFYEPYSEGRDNFACTYLIDDDKPHASDFRQVCKTVQTYLLELQGLMGAHGLNDVTKGCEYLSYWIYDKIKHNNSSRENIPNLYNAIDSLKKYRGLNEKCSNIQDFNIPEDEFNKKKELYFHAENLFWIENKYGKSVISDSSMYKKYLHECAEYYNDALLNNYCKNKKDFKSELTDFSSKFNKTKNFLNEKKIQITLEDLKPPELFECSAGAKSVLDGPPANPSDLESQQNPDTRYPNAQVADIEGTGTNPGTIAGTGLGISSVMFLSYLFLYKFKGYHHFIRPLIGNKKKTLNNLEDEDSEFFQTHEQKHINLDSTLYHVNYHSVQDD